MSGPYLNSLSTRIIATVAALLLSASIVLITIGHFQARELVFAQEESEGLVMADILQAAIEGELDEAVGPNGSDIERLVASTAREDHFRNIFVIRTDGAVVARASTMEQPALFEEQVARAMRDRATVTHVDRKRKVLSVVAPIPAGATAPHLLVMFERNLSDSLDRVRRLTQVRAAGATAIGALLGLAVVTLLRKAVIEPAAAIARQAESLGHGDLTARTGLNAATAGSREMHGLAQAFDTMGDRLQDLETQRLAADLSLRASEARYRALVEGSDELICRSLPDGRLTFVNDAFCRHYRKSPQELLGTPFVELLPESERTLVTRVLAKIQREGAAIFEHSSIDANGAVRWHLWANRAVRSSEGGLLEYQAVAHDITARKLAEEKLRAANAELEERVHQRTSDLEVAVRELESFSYAVAHDLHSPLRSIDGFGQILAERLGPDVDAESLQLLARIRQRAQHMGTLIDGLLTLAQVARSEIDRTRIDLSSIATDAIGALRRAEPDREVEVVIQPGMEASADAGMLRIALSQLVGNAWKFTRGVERPRIEIGVTRKLNQAVAYVRDNGAGFDMAYVERLFTAFRRLHSTGEQSGSGLGLAIVQRVVMRHGGQLWAEGAPGQGATFYFTLAGS